MRRKDGANPPTTRRWPWVVGGLFAGLGVLLAACGIYLAVLWPTLPTVEDIRQAKVPEPSMLLAADGSTLAVFRQARQERITLQKVSPHVIQALIATEDARFYEHHGIDFKRTLSAMLHTVRGTPQGGSTITQQLVRNLFPEDIGRSRTLGRKVKEMITALRIEGIYSKDQILEAYLNTVPFPYNVYGIEMASRTYYDKPAAALDTLEAATLVGMLKGPQYYNPVAHPERVRQRRNLVLRQMLKHHDLKEAEYHELRPRAMRVNVTLPADPPGPAPHFTAFIRKWLADWAEQNGHDV